MNDRQDGQHEVNDDGDRETRRPLDGAHLSGELLNAYLDGELSGSERSIVQAHISSCAECSGQLAELRATTALLRALPAPRARRSFQLGAEHVQTRRSFWDRLAGQLMPALPALRAATVAIALLLAAVSIRNSIETSENSRPTSVSQAPITTQAAAPTATAQQGPNQNLAALPTNQQMPAPAEEAATGARSGAAATEAPQPAAASNKTAGSSATEAEAPPDDSVNSTFAESSAAEPAPKSAAANDTDAVAQDQAGDAAAGQEPISNEPPGDGQGAAAKATGGEAIFAPSPTASASPTAQPTKEPATPSPVASTAAPEPVNVQNVPPGTTTANGDDWGGWRIAQLALSIALVLMIALTITLHRLRKTRSIETT